jgi:hypothetical protein
MLEANSREARSAWLNAFPRRMCSSVENAATSLGEDGHLSPDGFSFTLSGEELLIPYRLYACEPEYKHRVLPGEEALILSCMYTRHHNGFVREEQLRQILTAHEDWMVPYVIQLLGEYVTSIHQLLLANLPILVSPPYMEAYEDNPRFIECTKSRIISYWNCNYGHTLIVDYPAFQVAKALGWWKASELRQLRRRGY